jgi:hypothetical protein
MTLRSLSYVGHLLEALLYACTLSRSQVVWCVGRGQLWLTQSFAMINKE